MNIDPPNPGTPSLPPEERYRLYVDESGDHVFNKLEEPSHRYLCLLGCWFRMGDYLPFHWDLEKFKQEQLRHSPDEPVVLHREDIINRRGAFWRLRDPDAAARFDAGLVKILSNAEFRVVAVVIDKLRLREKYPSPAHPYHLALGFLLQRYCGYLNHINRQGDVMAETRGKKEDFLLRDCYSWVYNRGSWGKMTSDAFQQALTSHELKLKPKTANIAGLQLADLLGHPVKQSVLAENGVQVPTPTAFATTIVSVANLKFNRHLYNGRVEGYGSVLFPK